MNNRENIIGLFHRTGYRAAPVKLDLCPALWEKYKAVAGETPFHEFFDYPGGFCEDYVPGLAVREQQVDWQRYYPRPLAPKTYFDMWGIAHEPGSADAHHMTRMHHPMAGLTSIAQMHSYPWPTFDESSWAAMKAAADKAHALGRAGGGHMACTIWETSWYMRDMTMLMMDMTMGDEKAALLLDKITDYSCQQAAAHARAGTDILHIGDDIGTQDSIMMSLEMYREWLKPRLARVIAAARKHKPDILIHYHSCGYVEPFIEDLIDTGIDILNPVQPECMDFAKLHREYGDRLSFDGTLGTQTTMPFGTPADVKRTVRRNLDIAGPRGGLFVSPTHLLEPEVPWENVVAYVAACRDYGKAGG